MPKLMVVVGVEIDGAKTLPILIYLPLAFVLEAVV